MRWARFGDDGFADRWSEIKTAVEAMVISTEVLVEVVPPEFIKRLCRDAMWQVQKFAETGKSFVVTFRFLLICCMLGIKVMFCSVGFDSARIL